MHCIGRCLVVLPEIRYCSTVGHYHILESPIITKDLLEQTSAAAAWLIVPTLISTHHLANVTFLDSILESWHIGFPKVAW